MEQIVVKAEMQSNEEILLFYVDEDGGNEEGVITTIESIEQDHVEGLKQQNSYVVENVGGSIDVTDTMQENNDNSKESWSEEETRRLLVFYIDNKETFISGATKKRHLWSIACKTMLYGKNPNICEMKLLNMKRKYAQLRIDQMRGVCVDWPYFDLCHQAFHDDNLVNIMLNEDKKQEAQQPLISIPLTSKPHDCGIMVVKKVNSSRSSDEKVELMLNLYLNLKKNFQKDTRQRALWETIAAELGEDNAEYWQKRFFNYKQHYIRLLDKRKVSGHDSVSWPYMSLFDQIFEGDEEFHRKFVSPITAHMAVTNEIDQQEWNYTEMTVLSKYYFDCFQEFQDPTIPNNFLWNEVGRLLDKSPEICKKKYEELKNAHLDKYIQVEYDLRSRVPLAILFDNIISKEIQIEISKGTKRSGQLEMWATEVTDELVQFFYENIEMFKDPVCHFVCWAAVSRKLKKSVENCRRQWEDLVLLYKNILEDKKENPDMQIDWRYIELFDRIFDYGMDTNLLDGYEKFQEENRYNDSGKIGVKKVNIKMDDEKYNSENGTDDEEYFDERGFTTRSKRRSGDSKAFKILEFYQKNKDKFATTLRKKQALWEVLAKQVGISAIQCAHRFRNLKQVYKAYVQREINKPEMPILWPYYALCKKVFGYRALKSKLKNGKMESDDSEDWTAREIKQVITYFSRNFDEITNNIEDKSKWAALAADIDKTENSCCEKFLELRKSYRKLKTMRSRNPDVKVSWKYFGMMDDIYSSREGADEVQNHMDISVQNSDGYEELSMDVDVKNELQDDDFQCIIVLPEGQELSDIKDAEIMTQTNFEITSTETNQPINANSGLTKWTKRTKKRLLILYLNYIRSHKGREINPTEMWTEIASKLPNKTPLSCRKIFAKLKKNHLELAKEDDVNKKKTPYYTLVEKILAMKPKFAKTSQNKMLSEGKSYKDVPLNTLKVQQALEYYLSHLEEFVNPRLEKKYVWMDLANSVSEPLTKVFNKINYLKQYYNSETDEVAGEKTAFGEYLKEITAKEKLLKDEVDKLPKPAMIGDDEEVFWSDDEVEKLLIWYLSHLDKFKNPKYVRSYLWTDAASVLNKNALACSKKMSEIRTQYRTIVRETPEELANWRFYDLCQKIYGTGKKSASVSSN